MGYKLRSPLNHGSASTSCRTAMSNGLSPRTTLSCSAFICIALVVLLMSLSSPAHTQDFDTVPEIKQWLAQTEHQGTIAPGTVITTQNWQQYKEFMPPGMQQMFAGSLYWKIPADARMTIDPTTPTPVSKYYIQATEQFGNQTKVVHKANGHYALANYVAGAPFPNPQEPDKGYKFLADNWFAYIPNLYVNTPENAAKFCVVDRFANISCTLLDFVYRQEGYETDPGVPRDMPEAPTVFYTEYNEVLAPEQSRYTAQLTVFYKDYENWQDSYVFVPALRRSLRLATTARCSPTAGSDLIQDDAKANGMNGGLALFQAKYLGHRKVLSFNKRFPAMKVGILGELPSAYLEPSMWPKPEWSHFQLRDAEIIDVRRVPSEALGYCYGARIMFLDPSSYYHVWTELYDSNFKLWKLLLPILRVDDLPIIGTTITNEGAFLLWDVQNAHFTLATSDGGIGRGAVFNQNAPAEFHDYRRFGSPAGLMQIFR
jgi:Protein of unknown function (DUF1329)